MEGSKFSRLTTLRVDKMSNRTIIIVAIACAIIAAGVTFGGYKIKGGFSAPGGWSANVDVGKAK